MRRKPSQTGGGDAADRFHGDGPSLEAQFSSATGDRRQASVSLLDAEELFFFFFFFEHEGATARPWVQRSCGLVAARV
jgi:hypothetical protein